MSPRAATRGVPRIELPVERHPLSCGALLLVSPRKSAPVTAVQVHVRGGRSLDAPGLEGTAYMTGGLLDQGTRTRTEAEISEVLEVAGGSLAGDASGLAGTIASPGTGLLLEVLADVLTTPKFPRKWVERHRGRLLDQLRVEEQDPRVQAERAFRRLVYGDHWLGQPSRGTPETVEKLERAHLVAHHRKHWVASRAVIAICGDVDSAKIAKRLDRLLADWKTGRDLPDTLPKFPSRGPRVGAFRANRQQVHVFLGHLGVRRDHPDYPALVVLDHVLGAGPGFTNRVSRRLRDELGLAYTVSANIHGSAGRLPGTFTAYIGTSPEHVETAIEGFREEMRRIRDELVGAEELAVAVDYLVGSFVLGFQRASRRANFLVSMERHGLSADVLETLPRAFAAVTPEEVRRVAREHLYPDECCLSAAGSVTRAQLKRALVV